MLLRECYNASHNWNLCVRSTAYIVHKRVVSLQLKKKNERDGKLLWYKGNKRLYEMPVQVILGAYSNYRVTCAGCQHIYPCY